MITLKENKDMRNGMIQSFKSLQKSKDVERILLQFLSGDERRDEGLDERVLEFLEDESTDLEQVVMCSAYYYPMGPNMLETKGFEIDGVDNYLIESVLLVYYASVFSLFAQEISVEILLLLNKFMMYGNTNDESVLFRFLLDFKSLLYSLDIHAFSSIKDEIISNQPLLFLENLIQLGEGYTHLYYYLKLLIQEPDNMILHIYTIVPYMDDFMFMFAVRLFTMGEDKCRDILNLAKILQVLPKTQINISLISEPPKKSVYRKNIGPAPTVLIEGDFKDKGKLTLDVVLLRCDDFSPLKKNELLGVVSQKITRESTYSFKLKVNSTSRQLGDTFVCLCFELRLHSGDSYEVLSSVNSIPMEIVSHSTMIEKKKEPPDIVEIIPPSGSAGTQIVILGSGFAESPYLAVKFGNVELTPVVYGQKTLIALVPQMFRTGVVDIQISNDRKYWSSPQSFFYLHEVGMQ